MVVKSFIPNLEDWVYHNRFVVISTLLGVLLIGVGVFVFSTGVFEPAKVEILDNSQIAGVSANGQKMVVEIGGAVENPGVYEVNLGDRVDQVLVLAGGLSANADREWVSKNLNRAARVQDGQKIYIPRQGEVSTVYSPRSAAGGSAVVGSPLTVDGLLNLNTASQGQLEGLPGIGAVRAQAIISGRPYSNVEEVYTRKIVPKSVYEKIKSSITAL
ncbi:MAG: SLBB domain-containing protein [Patescibacteria group bacterium]